MITWGVGMHFCSETLSVPNNWCHQMWYTLRKNSSLQCLSSSQSAFRWHSIEWTDSNPADPGDFPFTRLDITWTHCSKAADSGDLLFTGLEWQLSLQSCDKSKVTVQSAAHFSCYVHSPVSCFTIYATLAFILSMHHLEGWYWDIKQQATIQKIAYNKHQLEGF